MSKAMDRAIEFEKYSEVYKDAFVEGYEFRINSTLEGTNFVEAYYPREREIEKKIGHKSSASFGKGIEMAEIDRRS